jgi:hypothetical protein
MDADPHTGEFPGSSVMRDALPLGEIDRQHAPLDSPFRHLKDGIEHRSHTQGARASTTFGGGDHIFDPLPFLISQVAWIYFFVHLPILHNLRRLFRQALRFVAKRTEPTPDIHIRDLPNRPRSRRRPPYTLLAYPPTRRGGLRGAGGISTEARIAVNIDRGFCPKNRSAAVVPSVRVRKKLCTAVRQARFLGRSSPRS